MKRAIILTLSAVVAALLVDPAVDALAPVAAAFAILAVAVLDLILVLVAVLIVVAH